MKPITPHVVNQTPDPLPLHVELILQKMFADYEQVFVQRRFGRGYSGGLVYQARAARRPGDSELPSVVKVDHANQIRQEWAAYHAHIHRRLPNVAAIDGEPVYLDDDSYGGLRYPLAGDGVFQVESLANYLLHASPADVRYVLQERLFPSLAQLWQKNTFHDPLPLRQFYDSALPANLFIQNETPPAGLTPERLTPEWARRKTLTAGQFVELSGFQVFRLDQTWNRLLLDLPRDWPDGFRLSFSPLLDTNGFERGQAMPRPLTGLVTQTRQGFMDSQARSVIGLEAADRFLHRAGQRWPNPFVLWPELLRGSVGGRVGPIHGDLHLENVLVETAGRNVYLIDFALARQDHILRDLVSLEMSIILRLANERWPADEQPEAIRDFYERLGCASRQSQPVEPPAELAALFTALVALRQAAGAYLGQLGQWDEYDKCLFLVLLGALRFDNLDKPSRQLAFWAAAAVARLLETSPDCTKFEQRPGDKPDNEAQKPPSNETVREVVITVLTPEQKVKLRIQMVERLSDRELRDVCFDLGVDYESLPGEGKASKARELIAHCDRRGRLADLLRVLVLLDNTIPWAGLPAVTPSTQSAPQSGRRHRLEQERDSLQQEWNLLREKIKQMRAALAIETSVPIRFQLEKQLEAETARLQQLTSALEEVEAKLN
ncbi:MAG: phosphotransferase [Chloroflexota bacterium]